MKSAKALEVSYLTIRRSLGGIGLGMSWLMWLATYLDGFTGPQPSISSYYFTNAGNLFVGIMTALALFLVCYRGYGRPDDVVSTVAGVAALGIALFPDVSADSPPADYLFHRQLGLDTTRNIHFAAAGIFFGLLALMSGFLFTRTDTRPGHRPTRQKLWRNNVYRACAAIIAMAIVCVGVVTYLPYDCPIRTCNPVFWLETVALTAFGASWLVKGDTLLRDGT